MFKPARGGNCGDVCRGACGNAGDVPAGGVCDVAGCPAGVAGVDCDGACEEKLSATPPSITTKKSAPIRKTIRPPARTFIRTRIPTLSSIPNPSAFPRRSNLSLREKGTASLTVPPCIAMKTLIQPISSSFLRIGPLQRFPPELALRLRLRRLLLLSLPACRAQGTHIRPHLMALFRR